MKALGKIGGALAVFTGRAVSTKPAETAPAPWVPPAPAPWVPVDAAAGGGARLVFAFDATASRSRAWEHSKRLQDRLLTTLPGRLEVALAIHSGGQVKFSSFTRNPARLRDLAAGVECRAGATKLLPILDRVARRDHAGVVLYIGDCFEEDQASARRIADALLARGTRVIILHDGPPPDAFAVIAERTGGALLPFDTSALDRLADLLQAVAVLAVGGAELLHQQQAAMPAAAVLLENLDPKRLLIGRSKQ